MGGVNASKITNDVNRSIVWLDASVNDTEENINAQQLLHTPTNHLKTYTNDKECENYIRSVPNGHRIILIVGGRFGQLIVPRIHTLLQVSSIFVYCMDKRNEEWTKTYKKIKGVTEELNELVLQVLTAQEKQINRDRFEEPLSINIYHTNKSQEQSTSKLNGQFVHSQILFDCLLRMKSSSTEKNELITYCKKRYVNNTSQLNVIHEFEQDYIADHALKWYTRDCFLYKLLNSALRMLNIDLLYLLNFFIRDLYRQLKNNQYSLPIDVYRGQIMSKREVQQLKNSIGQLISMNSFLSTTQDRQVAIFFLGDTGAPTGDDSQSVLFEIKVDPHIVGIKPFADITPFSYITDEDEVLIMLGSIFRIVHIRNESHLCIIQLVLCSENDCDVKPIIDQLKFDYHGTGNTNAAVYGVVLVKMGKIDEGEKYIQHGLDESLSDHNMNKTKAFNLCLHYKNLGNVVAQKGDFNKSLDYFHKALEGTLKLTNSDDPYVADIHYDIGGVYFHKGDNRRAIESYNTALTIYRRKLGEDDLKVGHVLSNIGCIHMKQRQYSEALHYQQKALAIQQKHLPANHHILGETHSNMGTLYRGLRNFDLALEHYNMALKIYEKSLPSQHPHVASTYNGIGTIYSDKRHYQEALLYFEKAAAIFRQTGISNHPDAADVQRNINGMKNALHGLK